MFATPTGRAALLAVTVGLATTSAAAHESAPVSGTSSKHFGAHCSLPSQRTDCGWLACNRTSATCAACVEAADCWQEGLECDAGLCRPKPLGPRFAESWRPYVAVVLAIVVSVVGAVAGVGGGGMLVPLFAVVLGMPLKQAVSLSLATIAGQSMTGVVLFQLRRRHPNASNRPIINYVLLTYWLPASLAGTTLGRLAGAVVPDWLRLGALVVLLGYVLYRVIRRFRSHRAADRTASVNAGESAPSGVAPGTALDSEQPEATVGFAVNAEPACEPSDASGMTQRLLSQDTVAAGVSPVDANAASFSHAKTGGGVAEGSEAGREEFGLLDGGFPQYPLREGGLVALTFGSLMLFKLLRLDSFHVATCGSAGWWGLVSSSIGWQTAVTVVMALWLRKRAARIAAGLVAPSQLPFVWNAHTGLLCPLVAAFAGCAATVLGVGGGVILGPLILEVLDAEEAGATTSMATFLVSTAAALSYFIDGTVPLAYGGAFVAAGVIAQLVGQLVVNRLVRHCGGGQGMLVILSMAAVVGGSLLSLVGLAGYHTANLVRYHGSLGFGSLCE